MVSPRPLSYFSIADRQMESLIPAGDLFEQSLLENVLFYRRSLLIPDVFFFISTPLTRHVLTKGGSNSFLGMCLSNGFVVPALREGRTFEASLAAIKSQRIQGLQPGGIPERVMASLQVAQERSNQFESVIWPEQQLGTMFENELRATLYNAARAPQVLNGAGVTQGELDELWLLTKTWRTECLDQAARRTQVSGGSGIRRSEILNVISIGLGYPDNIVHDVNSIFDIADKLHRRRELEAFMLWVNLCYHKNQAFAFNCALSFPRFDGISAVTGGGLLPQPTTQNDEVKVHEIRETIVVPHADLLINRDFDEIISIRKNEGAEYFDRLYQWEYNPNEDTANDVRLALNRYSERLRIVASRQGNSNIEEKFINHLNTSEINREISLSWTRAILEIGKSWIEIPANLLGLIPISKALHRTRSLTTLRTKSTTIKHQIKIPTEINSSILM